MVDIKGRASRRIVDLAIGALCNLEHRGATGAEADTGDGAGILLQVPDRFLREVVGFPLPPAGQLRGRALLPARPTRWTREKTVAAIEAARGRGGPHHAGLAGRPRRAGRARRVGPPASCPSSASSSSADPAGTAGIDLDRRIYPLRKRIEHEVGATGDDGRRPYFPSLSARTLIYKGMLTTRSWPRSTPT